MKFANKFWFMAAAVSVLVVPLRIHSQDSQSHTSKTVWDHPSALNEGLDFIRRGGRYVIVGQLGSGTTTIKPSLIVSKQLRILGSLSGRAKAYWKALEFVSTHQQHFPFDRMISTHYSLDEVNVALLRMKNYEEIKPMIEPWK